MKKLLAIVLVALLGVSLWSSWSPGVVGTSTGVMSGAPRQTVVNVQDYGADPTGVGDSTTFINNAIATAKSAGQIAVVYFPDGTYKITAAINPGVALITYQGATRANTIIQQATANTPVFQWTSDLSGGAHSITFEHLTLTNANLPTATSTQQYGSSSGRTPRGRSAAATGSICAGFRISACKASMSASGRTPPAALVSGVVFDHPRQHILQQ